MKHFLLIVFIFIFSGLIQAQQASVSGSLQDTINYKPMAYSSIALIRKSDSTLYRKLWANENGQFSFKQMPAGVYQLRITRPSFADYEEEFTLAENEQKQFGTIVLYSKANLLRDVIIREKRNAITIKGDTTEFLVDSFLVNKNSNVEDLLKKLPGIQVDKNGKITAQGQEVKKVLVDGEEFFGDDPTVATRNIKAENVEAVQVFDKKSDQAAFTGIEDGEKNKTINLKLKEDAKKGFFGKASAGFGTQDRYEHDAMINKFKNKQKISLYAAGSNTNKTGLNWEDEQKYGAGNNMFTDESSGNIYSYYEGGSESFDGVGIPSTFYAGAVFADKFKTDTHSVNINAKYQQLDVSGFNNNFTKYILPDTLYFNNQLNEFKNTKQLTKGGGKYEWKIDSLTTIKINANGSQLRAQNLNSYTTENLNINNEKVNDNIRTQNNDKVENKYSMGFNLGRKFRTKGRSFSFNFDQSNVVGESDGFLNSSTRFYEGGILKTQTNIDQQKITSTNSNNFSANMTYTEPLSTKWFIVADANSKYNINQSKRISLEKDATGKYTKIVDSLSNELRYDIMVSGGGLALKYNTKKLIYSIGGKVSYTDLQQKDVETGLTQSQYFVNLFPSANLQYKVRNNSSLNVSYSGRTQQPSLQQIQPILDNSNPLDLYLGNPDLQQSFRSSFSLSYNNYKPVSGSGMYLYASYSFTQNDFTNFDRIDQFGRKIHQTVNVDGNQGGNFWGDYWTEIKGTDVSLSFSLNGDYNRNQNFINGEANTNNSGTIGPGFNVYYEIDEKLDLGINGNWDYNFSRTTLREDIVTRYWISTYGIEGKYKFKKKYTIGSECNLNYRQQTEAFPQNFNTIIWNASISRTFLKSDNLIFEVACNDLLNQNIGFRRDANSNYVNENTYTVLKRYFMISLTWNFSKGGIGGGGDE